MRQNVFSRNNSGLGFSGSLQVSFWFVRFPLSTLGAYAND